MVQCLTMTQIKRLQQTQIVTCLTVGPGVQLGPVLSWRLIMKLFLLPLSSLQLLQEGLLSITRKSIFTRYLVNRLVKLAQKNMW